MNCKLMGAAAVVLVLTAVWACSAPEEPILTRFFAASALRDTTALSNFSLVIFEPRVDGIVQKFTIDSIGSEQRRPLSQVPLSEVGPLVRLSVDDPGIATGDPAPVAGEIAAKQLIISAQVALPNGQVVRKRLVITMERAVLAGGRRVGQWVITGIKGPSDTP